MPTECDLLWTKSNGFTSMKRIPIYATFFSFIILIASHAAEAPGLSPQEQQLFAIVKEVQAQQLAIAENQAKIEEKLATIAESLRMARIYSLRGGGK